MSASACTLLNVVLVVMIDLQKKSVIGQTVGLVYGTYSQALLYFFFEPFPACPLFHALGYC